MQLRQKQDINVCGGLRGKVKSAHQQISIPASFPQLFNLPHIGQCIRSSGLVNDLVVMFLNIRGIVNIDLVTTEKKFSGKII